MNYIEISLSELVDTISDTKRINKDEVILINTSDVLNGEVLNHTYTKNENLRGQFKKRFKQDDILYSEIRPANKRFAYINFDSNDYIASTKLMVLRRKSDQITNRYLYYCLTNDSFINKMQQLAEARSGTFPQITFDVLKNESIYLPSINCQNKISMILDNINDKIELNNKTNNNLYEYINLYLNSLVSDEVMPIYNFGKVQGGYAFKSKDLKDESTNNRIIKIKNLRSEISTDVCNSQFVDDEIIEKVDKKFQLYSGDVVIAMTGAELGKTGFIYGKDNYFLNQRVCVIRGNNKKEEIYLKILMLSKTFQVLLNSKGYGSAQPNISTSDIENIEINNINEEKLNMFYEVANPIYQKIILNCEENLVLKKLRDTLLPKLMNGEIDLENIEI